MTESPEDPAPVVPLRVSRRRALSILGGATLGAVAVACSRGGSDTSANPTPSSAGSTTGAGSTPSAAAGQADCVLTPEMTEGPFWLDLNKVRSDITEGKEGTPLTLDLTVVDATSCQPIKDAAVDVWHADASGAYSGVSNSGGSASNNKTFLRGIQMTDANGKATFKTIYPGWYRGRTVHIHVKVSTGGNEVHTGQLFFPEDISAEVFDDSEYADRGDPDTSNAQDGIFRGGGSQSILKMTKTGDGYTGSLTMGVRAS